MSLEKLEAKNISRAAGLVNNLQDAAGKNQKALAKNKDEYNLLIAIGQEIAEDLAAAKEYLDDLTKAKSD